MENKKGVSAVVAAIILVALVIAVVAIVWAVVNNLVKGGLGESEACFGVFEKVTLNPRYTCYDIDPEEFRFSISIGEIDVDEVLVGISAEGSSVSFKISKTAGAIDNLVTYPLRSSSIVLPSKNAGLTYIFDMSGAGFSEAPDSISIAPKIKGVQCGASDSMNYIERCLD